jgi:prepilin-type N-terminal cleavage/methylation domain-containing protein
MGESKQFRIGGFTLIELLIVISILVVLSVMIALPFFGKDYDARYQTTKSNLGVIRTAISMFRSRHHTFPKPGATGGELATQNGENTLGAILANFPGYGDGTSYIRGGLPRELLSTHLGNSYICVVPSVLDFHSDQSSYGGCANIDSDTAPSSRGGYVYCPANGAIRLNFLVLGDDFRTEDQLKIGSLNDDWDVWSNTNIQTNDWPVRW